MASDVCGTGWYMVPWASSTEAVQCPTHRAWLNKRSTVPGTGLGLAVVLGESPSRAGHAEEHSQSCRGWRLLPAHPLLCLGLAQGSTGSFLKLHPLLGQKQVTADSAAAEAG